jgi:hypothetical protein
MDPYSFIATVILPAWPTRFRKKENKALLETILNREIPSHILLRILWLKPEDTCNFETLYKDWQWWLSQKGDCDRNNTLCELKEFLFLTEFTCLNECTDCLPCPENITDINAFDDDVNNKKSDDAYKILKDINQLFGWEKFACLSMEKGSTDDLKDTERPATLHSLAARINDATTTDQNVLPPEETGSQKKDVTRLLNKRLSGYKANVQRLYEDSNKNAVFEKALLVFGEEHLTEKINAILNELLNDQNPQDENHLLKQSQRDEVCKTLIWLYFDRTIFGENNTSKLALVSDELNKLRQNNFDLEALFTGWKPEEFAKYGKAKDIESVRKFIINR